MDPIYVPANVLVTEGPHKGRKGTVQGVYAMNADVKFSDGNEPSRAGIHRENLRVIAARSRRAPEAFDKDFHETSQSVALADFAEFPDSEKRKEACADPMCGREDVHPEHGAAAEFPAAVEQMSDPEHHKELMGVPFSERHECPIEGCRLSAEEHHRLAYGMIAENKDMRRRLALLEGQG